MSVNMSFFAVLMGAMGIACDLAVGGENSNPAPFAKLPMAEASTAQRSVEQFDRVIGICHLSENPFVPKSAVNVLSPPQELAVYFRKQEHYTIEGKPRVSVMQMPAHGRLEDIGDGNYAFYPEMGYIGNDRATLLIEVAGKKVRMDYFFNVMQSIPQQYEGEPSIYKQGYCPKKVRVWKISSSTAATASTDATALVSTRG